MARRQTTEEGDSGARKDSECGDVSDEGLMKRKTKIVIGALVGLSLVFQLWKNFRGEESIAIEKIVRTLNKECPIQIDSNTIVFSYDYLAPDTMVLNYQMLNVLKNSIDIEATKQAFEPVLRKNIGQKIDPKTMLFSTFNSVYRYYDRNQEFLFEIAISMRKPLPYET
jgi:hypothetical protein